MRMSDKLTFDEKQLANLLRDEILKNSQNLVHCEPRVAEMSDFELISQNKKPYVSPIFSMNEDELLAFVEEFEVGELATLTEAELNHIADVMGVDPKSLV